MKYSQNAPFKYRVVQECRGIILDADKNYDVVSWPYLKFFNYGEFEFLWVSLSVILSYRWKRSGINRLEYSSSVWEAWWQLSNVVLVRIHHYYFCELIREVSWWIPCLKFRHSRRLCSVFLPSPPSFLIVDWETLALALLSCFGTSGIRRECPFLQIEEGVMFLNFVQLSIRLSTSIDFAEVILSYRKALQRSFNFSWMPGHENVTGTRSGCHSWGGGLVFHLIPIGLCWLSSSMAGKLPNRFHLLHWKKSLLLPGTWIPLLMVVCFRVVCVDE